MVGSDRGLCVTQGKTHCAMDQKFELFYQQHRSLSYTETIIQTLQTAGLYNPKLKNHNVYGYCTELQTSERETYLVY